MVRLRLRLIYYNFVSAEKCLKGARPTAMPSILVYRMDICLQPDRIYLVSAFPSSIFVPQCFSMFAKILICGKHEYEHLAEVFDGVNMALTIAPSPRTSCHAAFTL
jgi:hypothetical protein